MTKSPLTNEVVLADPSNYTTSGRKGYKICKITPHHMAGILSRKKMCRIIPATRKKRKCKLLHRRGRRYRAKRTRRMQSLDLVFKQQRLSSNHDRDKRLRLQLEHIRKELEQFSKFVRGHLQKIQLPIDIRQYTKAEA